MPDSSLPGAELEYFLRTVSSAWGLALEEQMGILGSTVEDFLQMSKDAPAGGLARRADLAAEVNSIHASLRLIYSFDQDARGWLRRPNSAPVFGGLTPLQALMRHDAGLTLRIAKYAQSAASGDFS